jgi:hypothetical protein
VAARIREAFGVRTRRLRLRRQHLLGIARDVRAAQAGAQPAAELRGRTRDVVADHRHGVVLDPRAAREIDELDAQLAAAELAGDQDLRGRRRADPHERRPARLGLLRGCELARERCRLVGVHRGDRTRDAQLAAQQLAGLDATPWLVRHGVRIDDAARVPRQRAGHRRGRRALAMAAHRHRRRDARDDERAGDHPRQHAPPRHAIVERARDVARVLESLRRIDLEAAQDRALPARGQLRPALARRRRRLLEPEHRGRHRRVGAERQLARHHLEHHDAERIDVRRGRRRLALDLFGRHVRRRPDERLIGGERAAVADDPGLGAREAEVADHRALAAVAILHQQDVAALEVAVDDADLVRRL